MKHMNNKVLLYKHCYRYYGNLSWCSQGTLFKKKTTWTNALRARWQFAPVNIDERKKHTFSPCLALLCKQQTGFLSDIQQASRIIQENFSFWLPVREKTQENFNASPIPLHPWLFYACRIGTCIHTGLKASRLPPFCNSQHLQTCN